MKKKILVFLFTTFIGLIFITPVSGIKNLTCTYRQSVENEYEAEYTINGDRSVLNKITRIVTKRGESKPKEYDVTESYNSTFNINIKESESCPKNLESSAGETFKLIKAEEKKMEVSSTCDSYKSQDTCNKSMITGNVACVWVPVDEEINPNKGYCAVNNLQFIACGDAYDIPLLLPGLTSLLVNLLKIATPIILIIVSVITLVKALAASNEDEIKKAQKGLIRKIIAAAMVFFVITIVQFVILKFADNRKPSSINDKVETTNISSCLSCFLNNDCDTSTYYKVAGSGNVTCYYLDGTAFECKVNKVS